MNKLKYIRAKEIEELINDLEKEIDGLKKHALFSVDCDRITIFMKKTFLDDYGNYNKTEVIETELDSGILYNYYREAIGAKEKKIKTLEEEFDNL